MNRPKLDINIPIHGVSLELAICLSPGILSDYKPVPSEAVQFLLEQATFLISGHGSHHTQYPNFTSLLLSNNFLVVPSGSNPTGSGTTEYSTSNSLLMVSGVKGC